MTTRKLLVAPLLALAFAGGTLAEERPLVVHEWGTFTTLQDEAGAELPGINIDDEPVPPFVHNLQPFLLSSPFLSRWHWEHRMKGAPQRHPRVTMRLETPVIYFHVPAGQPKPLEVDVSVSFRGGWLTEFFPNAEPAAPGLEQRQFEFGDLNAETLSSLTWRDLRVGPLGDLPATDWPVWLAPRAVDAAGVTNSAGESEKYLFYRGVGHRAAPLRVTTDRARRELQLFSNFTDALPANGTAEIRRLWLVDVRPDGRAAFRGLPGVRVSGDPDQQLAECRYDFADTDYRDENLVDLKAQMHAALVADGLLADEAAALLETWSRAYFKSAGLRLFFLVPRVWTDHYLPLTISAPLPTQVARVMVGRIELKSERQVKLLEELARLPVSQDAWLEQIPESENRDRFLAGRIDFGDLGVVIPDDYQLYLALGRFRTALVAAEEQRHPSGNLTDFVNQYQLHPYRWANEPQQPIAADSK